MFLIIMRWFLKWNKVFKLFETELVLRILMFLTRNHPYVWVEVAKHVSTVRYICFVHFILEWEKSSNMHPLIGQLIIVPFFRIFENININNNFFIFRHPRYACSFTLFFFFLDESRFYTTYSIISVLSQYFLCGFLYNKLKWDQFVTYMKHNFVSNWNWNPSLFLLSARCCYDKWRHV